jgi:uncharacterized SAM-binding protein YcdF (DUF218 family)
MFFILSKILFFLITPIFWILALLIFSIFSKNQKTRKWALAIDIILLLLFTNYFIFNTVDKHWETPSGKASMVKEKYEYGVILGGMTSSNQITGITTYSECIDRLLQGIVLYRQGTIKKILITSGSGMVMGKEVKEAIILKGLCVELGIPGKDIVIETNSRNTRENAVFTREILNNYNQKILLITSAFHMRRAAGCFKKAGFKFDTFSTDPLEISVLGIDDYFIPKADPLTKWNVIIKEWIGFASYKVVGYI